MRAVVGLLAVATLSLSGCGRSIFELGLPGEGQDASAPTDGPVRDIGPRDAGRDGGPDIGPITRPDIGPVCNQDCSMFDTPCTRGVCDANSGQCVRQNRTDGTSCDDGSSCSVGDACRSGRCVGRGIDCSFLDGPCTQGVCDPNRPGQCISRASPDGSPCEDGLMCTMGDLCIQGFCNSGSATGGCSAPHEIPLVVGTQSLRAPLGCSADEVRNSCARITGDDAVWRLFADGPRLLQVSAPSPGRNASLSFQTRCGDTGSEGVCATPGGGRLTAQQLVQAGSNFVAVDPGNTGFPGNLSQIDVTIDPHDRCAGAVSLTVPPVGVTVEAAGMTIGANDDFQGCGGPGAPDHVYRVTVNQPSLVDFSLVVPPSGNSYDSLMYLFAGPCREGQQMFLACDDDANGNGQPRFSTTLQPGTYFLVIDGFSSNAGEYALRMTTQPTMATFVFPDFADARLQQVGNMFSQDGDFVEGARRPPLMSVGNAAINLQISNGMMCDTLDLAVMINGVMVGTSPVFPGMTNLNLNFVFPPIAGPNYSVRYEVLRDVAPGCGGVDLPLGISTVTLGP